MGKILSLTAADAWIAKQRAEGLCIGFTCGAFDILHAGHVDLLERARALCDRLLVAVNSDDSIRQYKALLRPVNPQGQRMRVVAALACVDAVVLMEDTRPAGLIERWHPDLYIKGGDYEAAGLRSQPQVEAYGGRVVLLPFHVDQSTSSILERVQAIALHHAGPGGGQTTARLVFVDRDGTLIRNVPYLHDPGRVELLPGAGEGLAALQDAGFRIVIVTNQQGIGLGYYKIEDFFAVNQELFRKLSPYEVKISRIYFCPHSLADGCACRKPRSALIDAALKHYGAQAADCYMLGDSAGDIEAGQAAGCCPVLIGRENAPGAQQAESFSDAVQWILAREAKRTNRREVSGHCGKSGEELP